MDKNIKKIVDSRQEINLMIINKLRDIVLAYPDLRFTQILSNLNLDKNRFYEEPDETLKSIEICESLYLDKI